MQKEIPILFSTPMVQALLAGRKTQTRRVVKPQPPSSVNLVRKLGNTYVSSYPNGATKPFDYQTKCKWSAGDLLWVREAWCGSTATVGMSFTLGVAEGQRMSFNAYRATYQGDKPPFGLTWKPSIHMPKSAARIWLQVESVRVERVRDISEEDAKVEGVKNYREGGRFIDYLLDHSLCGSAKESFETLWQSINGAESWEANPWVWVVSFKVLSTTGKPATVSTTTN